MVPKISSHFVYVYTLRCLNPTLYKECGVSMTWSLTMKIILRILFEGFLNSFASVWGFKSKGEVPFFINEVCLIVNKFSSYFCVLFLFTTYTRNI